MGKENSRESSGNKPQSAKPRRRNNHHSNNSDRCNDNNNNKPNTSRNSRSAREQRTEESQFRPAQNVMQDYAWWNTADDISKSVANVPFSRFPGLKEDIMPHMRDHSALKDQSTKSTPGAMMLSYLPTYGDSQAPTSALNLTMRSLYTFIRHLNSGKTNYEAPDLMLYILAVDQVYLAWQEAARLYDTVMTYTLDNRNIPKLLAQQLGISLTDFQSQLADYRAQLDVLALKISQLCIPAKFDIAKRHALLARAVFTDSSSSRSQMYFYSAEKYFKFSATADPNGGSLIMTPSIRTMNGSGVNGSILPKDVINKINELLDPILEDEDMNIMSGDIFHVYGSEGIYKMNFLSEASTLMLTFNEDVLQQIENTVTLPFTGEIRGEHTFQFRYVQKDQTLVSDYSNIYPYTMGWNEKVYFNSHKEAPSYEDVLEWSRGMTMVKFIPQQGASPEHFELTFGTEIVLYFELAAISHNTSTDVVDQFRTTSFFTYSTSAYSYGVNQYTDRSLCLLSAFDWHPIIYFYYAKFSGKTSEYDPAQISNSIYYGKIGDLKVYTILDYDTIKSLNDVAIIGVLGKMRLEK